MSLCTAARHRRYASASSTTAGGIWILYTSPPYIVRTPLDTAIAEILARARRASFLAREARPPEPDESAARQKTGPLPASVEAGSARQRRR
jgi:hypothetical protein